MSRCSTCHRRVAETEDGSGVCKFDGARVEHSPAQEPAAAPSIAGVALENGAAFGGFATVWRGVDGSARDVAIKVGRGRELAWRFDREARSLQALTPGLAPHFYEQGHLHDGRPFLVLEWLFAPTLARWLEQRERPPQLAEVLPIAQALVLCVEGLVAAGLLHRDLKPENLVFFERGRAASEAWPSFVALDFGTAHPLTPASELTTHSGQADVSEAGTVVGTSEYLAPERILGEADDERGEVYSLGVILYELSTLRLPFLSRGRAVLHDQLTLLPPPPSQWAELPAAWDRLLLECLAKDPSRRPSSVAELAQRLSELSRSPMPAASLSDRRSSVPEARSSEAEPAAILLLEGVNPAAMRVAAVVREFRGHVARLRGSRAICVFSATDCAAPLQAALEAGVELAGIQLATRLGLHLGSVELGRAPDGEPTVRGAAVDRPESWYSSAANDERVFVSSVAEDALGDAPVRRLRAAFAVLPVPAAPTSAAPSPCELAEAPLLGRDAQLSELEASLAAWQRAPGSVVRVVLGDSGTGKSRLARAIAERAGRGPTARVVLLGGRPGRGVVRARELWAALPSASPATTLSAALYASAAASPLAIVIDDAELAEDELLDQIEAALLRAPAQPIWVACLGDARFKRTRPLWGTRIDDFRALTLEALSEEAAKALTAELLRPAEYVPEEALLQLCRVAARLPGPLTEIVRQIRRAGLIKQRATRASHFLDTAELSRVPVPAMWQWAAAHELGALEPSLAAGAKLVAVLGPRVHRAELEAVQLGLRSLDAPFGAMDSTVLLRRLSEAGLLLPSPDDANEFAFRAASLAEGLASLVDPSARSLAHRLALDYHQGQRGAPQLSRIARHATALSLRELASAAHRELAEQAASAQRVVDAETHYTSALAQCDDELVRGRVLLGRARIYCRMYRLEESLRDLRQSIALAEQHRDWELAALAQFELATALDWAGDYVASATATLAALEVEARHLGATSSPRALVARGRAAWRRGEVSLAIELLSAGVSANSADHEVEQRIIARLLLGCALVQEGRRAQAAGCFAEVLADAEAAADGLHLCAALGNRAFLWAVEGETERCVADLTRAVSVAQRLGHPGTERTALLNLSEVLYWAGREGEALSWLKQARHLEERFIQRPLHSAVLLQARIALLQDDTAEARRALGWLAARGLPEAKATSALAFRSALLHVLAAAAPTPEPEPEKLLTWLEIAEASAHFLPAERAELEYFQLRSRWDTASSSERLTLLDEASAKCASEPVWLARMRALPR